MAANKNLGLIILCGLTGYLVYRQSLKAQETAWSSIAAPVPAPGTSGLGAMPRTRLSSRGGTNMLAGLPGVWVPESSSWDKPSTENNGVYGLGHLGRFSIKKAVQVAKTVAISAIPIVGPSLALKAAVKQVDMPPAVKKIATVAAAITMPVVGPAQVTQQLIASRGSSLISLPKASGKPQASTQTVTTTAPDGTQQPAQQIIYQDAAGNVITLEQYNALLASTGSGVPVQVQDGSNPPTYGGIDGLIWPQTQYQAWVNAQQAAAPTQPYSLNTAAPVAQSASVTNATPITYATSPTDTTTTGTDPNAGSSTQQGNIIMPDGTVLDSSGNPIPQASSPDTSAQPTGRFDGQASGGTNIATSAADAPANAPSGAGKVALLVAAVGAGAFFLFKK